MMTLMVTPGPRKPNAYQYDQMLEPLVEDLIKLARGVRMRVYQAELGRAERELVNGHLHALIVDYIARIENCGHAALATEKHFCLYCQMRRSWVAIPEGFDVENYELRNPINYLQAKYRWRQNPNQRDRLFKQNGTRFTVMDRVPGFYGNTSCPVDGMHMFATGTTQWLVMQLIVAPGMLGPRYTGQHKDDQPMARFDAGLRGVILPSFCDWIPPQLSNMTRRVKSEQWIHLVPLLPVLLYDAYRVGDAIPAGELPEAITNPLSTSSNSYRRSAYTIIYAGFIDYEKMLLKSPPTPQIASQVEKYGRSTRTFYDIASRIKSSTTLESPAPAPNLQRIF
ncbi:hypothetical protein FRC12_008975 [Ceratobasidium sp. 428]|nr:hypothetical protein FRC12_008975 [Ceratobasidium sp. 428]